MGRYFSDRFGLGFCLWLFSRISANFSFLLLRNLWRGIQGLWLSEFGILRNCFGFFLRSFSRTLFSHTRNSGSLRIWNRGIDDWGLLRLFVVILLVGLGDQSGTLISLHLCLVRIQAGFWGWCLWSFDKDFTIIVVDLSNLILTDLDLSVEILHLVVRNRKHWTLILNELH